jgi:ribosomal protein L32
MSSIMNELRTIVRLHGGPPTCFVCGQIVPVNDALENCDTTSQNHVCKKCLEAVRFEKIPVAVCSFCGSRFAPHKRSLVVTTNGVSEPFTRRYAWRCRKCEWKESVWEWA